MIPRIITAVLLLLSDPALFSSVWAQNYSKHPGLGEFVAHIETSVFLCHLNEILVEMTSRLVSTEDGKAKMTSAMNDASKCTKDAREKAKPLYTKAMKEASAKPGSEAKLKSVLAAWLSIMNAIPRVNRSEREL